MQVEQGRDSGKIILPEVVDLTNAVEFEEALESLYQKEFNTILVDCKHLAMIDSAGLGRLVLYQKKLKERGAQLQIIHVTNDYIKHLFDMIELNRFIPIKES